LLQRFYRGQSPSVMRPGVPAGSVFFQKIEQFNQGLSRIVNSSLFELLFPVRHFAPLLDSQ
jgi:hypothetical protein